VPDIATRNLRLSKPLGWFRNRGSHEVGLGQLLQRNNNVP
jgi:hypothetical protein